MTKWELVENIDDIWICERLKVPSGWLLRTVVVGGDERKVGCSKLLIEDKDHSWKLEPLALKEHRSKELDETVNEDNVSTNYLWVPGGWVFTTYPLGDCAHHIYKIFVPDPEHVWAP